VERSWEFVRVEDDVVGRAYALKHWKTDERREFSIRWGPGPSGVSLDRRNQILREYVMNVENPPRRIGLDRHGNVIEVVADG
jgi:hypothetical protein